VAERDLEGGPWRDVPGAGAAGGLGFGLLAFTGATLTGGAALVADLVGLTEAARGAQLVITGEGALDDRSLTGKVVEHVAGVARDAGAGVYAIAGRATLSDTGFFDEVAELGPGGPNNAAALVAEHAARLAANTGRRSSPPRGGAARPSS